MWDNLIDKALTQEERFESFNWLIHARRELPESYVAIDEESAAYLFNHRLTKLNPSQVTPIALQCFYRYFCDANARVHRISWLDREEDFVVNDLNLLGYSSLWEIMLEVPFDDVAEMSRTFLIQIHDRVSPKVVNLRGKEFLRDEFLSLCMVKGSFVR